MATGLDELEERPRQHDPFSNSMFEEARAAEAPSPSRVNSRANRIKAADLADRGIPTFRNASGDVAPVTDDTGAALNAFDSRHGIAYDSAGQPKKISYDDTGPPKLSDPFGDLPIRTNPETGALEKTGKGGLYQYLGQDPAVTSQLRRKETDKQIRNEATLVGRKLTLDEHDLTLGTKQHDELKKSLTEKVPTLLDPKFEGADPDTVRKAIDDHFNAEYASKEANATAGWFSSDLSPEATELRRSIDTRKAAALADAETVFGLKERLGGLTETVGASREQERLQIETLLAHSRGEEGPLDKVALNEAAKAAPGLYPPEEDWKRILGSDKAVEEIHDRVRGGTVPPEAAPATVAATHDYKDALKKADKLEKTDPEKASQYRNFATSILQGLTSGLVEITKSMASAPSWSAAIDPIRQLGMIGVAAESLVTGQTQEEVRKSKTGKAEAVTTAMDKLVDERLKDSIGTKAGHFIGGLAPFVGVALATRGKNIATPLMASLFYTSGFQRTYEDAKAHGMDEDKAQAAGIGVGAINAVLAMPLKTVGAAVEAVFGNTAPKVIQQAITNAYEAGGASALGTLLGKLAEQIKAGGAGSEALRKEAVEGIQTVMAEIAKPAARRVADVAKTAATHAAIGAGVQTASNLVSKTYDPERGLFEGVPEQAIGFGVLGTFSKGFEQIAAARKAKQALDLISSARKGGGKPPAAGQLGGGEPPPSPTKPGGSDNATSPRNRRQDVQVQPAGGEPPATGSSPAKPVDAKITATQPVKTDAAKPAAEAALLTAEKAFVEQGGHADKLDAQNKLVQLQKAFPDPTARVAAIEKHLAEADDAEFQTTGSKFVVRETTERKQLLERRAPDLSTIDQSLSADNPIDQAANTAATSPQNELSEPSQAQKEAGNYQKGHIQVGGLDISIENPAGSRRKPEFAPLASHYGYIKGTVGADKDHVDVFVKQGTPADYSGPVFVVNQHKASGAFDEHKVILGVSTIAEARAEYLKNYQAGWKGGKSIVTFESPAEFKMWATSKVHNVPQSGTKGQPAVGYHLPKRIGQVAGELQISYSGLDAKGRWTFQDTGTDRPSGITIEAGSTPDQVRSAVEKAREKGGSSIEEQKVGKLAMGAMAKHRDTLTKLGHSTVPKLGETDTESGIQAKTSGDLRASPTGKVETVITIDAKKLSKAVEKLDDRAKSKFIQRAIEEEILHVAGETWERQAPENKARVKEWGAEKDELDAHLSKSYEGWDGLSDRQKGHEKLRAVLQKRWTGKLTEAAYRVLKDFLKYLRGIYEKLTPGQREIVDGVETILKGETKSPKAPAPAPKPKVETKPEISGAQKPTKLQVRGRELNERLLAIKDFPATEGTVIRTLIRSGTGTSLDQAEAKIVKLEAKVKPAQTTTPTAGTPAIDDKASAALDAAFEGLFAATPTVEQKAIPAEKIGGFVAAAQELVRQNVDTPQKLADLLESRYQGKARPFSQALWDMLGTVQPKLRGTHDWPAIYNFEVPKKADSGTTAAASNEAAPATILPQNADQLTRQIALSLQTGPVTRKQLTELAKESGLSVKEVDEAAELGIVQASRAIASGEGTAEQKFDELVELYDRQPNLTAKTSTSKVNQAYSTPAPLAYAAGVMAGLPTAKSAYEPTAGNGLLTIAGDPKIFHVNEMNEGRLANLKSQGFTLVTGSDALSVTPGARDKYDAIVMNPPFGTILGDDQSSKEFLLAGTDDTTKNIDQAIALHGLQDLAENGRAVLILGGKNIKDPEERAKAYATTNQMKFWKPLYEQYQVVDHFTVDGDLYSKQGAGWPVDVIVIAGRGQSRIQLPSADGPRIISSWNDLRSEISRTDEQRIAAGRYTPERHSAQIVDAIGAIRGIAGSEPTARPKGDTERSEIADGGARSRTDIVRLDPGQQPVVSGGPEPSPVAARGVGRVGSGADPGQPEQSGQQLGQFRVPYKPASKLPSFSIFVPTNMETPAREALAKLEQKVGSIDAFVREKLAYPKDAPMERYFSAEQMDALALAVDAIENQTAFVLGDQGGVGKGRTAAGMMRYSIKQGKLPIFITKDVKLYAAMVEDLHDIGSDDITPLFTDNGLAFEDFSGTKWKQGSMREVMKEIARTGKLPGAEALFTTYSQIQTDLPSQFSASPAERAAMKAKHQAPPDGVRMEALKRLAPGSIIIADESHLAAGDSIRAWRLAPLLAQAHGVYYLSATFAKRPDSMGIYSRTSLSHATSSMDDLVSAMRQGGVPLQQVVSATLASDGLYLRRERDFGHAVFRTHINLDTKDRDTFLADNYTDGIRTILAISNKMKSAKDYLNKIIRREGKQMQLENPPRIETTNFSSKLHNLISQYLFAIKSEAMVRRAVEGVTKGFTNKEGKTVPHKVVVTFQNTMEQPILALERSKRPLTFNGMLLHYLDSQRVLVSGRGPNAKVTIISDNPDPNFADTSDPLLQKMILKPKQPTKEDPSDSTVNEAALAELFRRIMSGVFKEAEAKLEGLDLADMPLSPIDHIRRQLTQAGIKVAEITKRGTGIDEDGLIYKLHPSSNTKAAHLRYLKDFNDGDTQVLLMNASGSTGISAHASAKFKSQEPRAMIIGQPHLDINEFMQTLYRIDRTGQVHQPYYELLQTAIPAELRPAAILGRKMAGLNANTTSNAENEISTGNKGVDIFNQYGDEVVYNYLKSDRVFTEMLDMPKIMEGDNLMPIADVLALYEENGQFAAAVTGRAAVLLTSEQEIFWEKVMADYVAHIDYLNELGENELVSDTVDLKAETLESKELTPAKKGTSGFDAASVMETIKADIGMKPLPATEVIDLMEKLGENAYEIKAGWEESARAWKAAELTRLSEKVLSWDAEKKAHYEARWREQEEEISMALGLIGSGLHIKTEKGMDGYGAITDVKFDDEHPLTPSKQIFTVHVNTTKKTLRVPASQLPTIARYAVGDFADVYESTAERSNQRYMITGNLLAAYLAIRDAAPTAKIVQYTTGKGDLRQGILMPGKFKLGSLTKKRVVESPQHMLELLKAGRSLTNAGGEVTLVKAPSGGFVMRVPSSRVQGGAFWRDSQLARHLDGGEFVERGGAMIGKFGYDNSHLIYQRLLDLNASLFFTEQGDSGASNEALGAARPVRAVKAFGESVGGVAKSVGMTVKESLTMLQHLVSPTTGVAMDAHDQVMRMLGQRNQKGYETDRVLEAAREAFDKMPRPEQIAFVDRMKQGEAQPTPELQHVANAMRKIDTESWEAAQAAYKGLGFKDAEVPLKWLDNHYRVLWKKIPGSTEEEKGEWIGKARRGLRGSMGQHKQHTLETMSDGITMGGVPYSYNPVEMFKLAQADLWKLTTTLRTWKWAKDNGFVEYVRGAFPKAPEGMVELDDAIARVYFPAESGEGLIQGGKFFVEEGFGRLLNNYLSRDYIRATRLGRGLMWLKNATTSLELSLSPFHAVFETLEMVGSDIGLGLSKLANRGIRSALHGDLGPAASGIMDIIKSPTSPVTAWHLGREIRKAAGDPEAYFKTDAGKKMLKSYPRAREFIDDLFMAGWKPNELEQDWKNQSVRTFIESVEDIKAGSSDNYIGAGLRAFPAANEMLMKPLFDWYIPSLKVAQFFKEYAEALEQNKQKLASGFITRAKIARSIWTFVEDRFGETNFDSLFWNRNFKTAMQLMFRSVTWKLGSLHAFAGSFGGQGKEFVDAFKERRAPELHRNTAWLFGMFLLTATLGAIISKVLGGKDPESLVDYVFPQIDPKDDKARVSIPTYFKDMVHLIHSPKSYVTSSMSGWIGKLADLLRNKDYFGVQIRDTDDSVVQQALQVGKYATESMLPFSIRGYKQLSAQDVGALRKALAVLAVNPAPRHVSQSKAEKQAEEYWKGRSTEAGIKPEQFESKREKSRLVKQIRHGKSPNISAALASGVIKPADIPALYKRAAIGALPSQVLHMPLADAEKVYQRATLAERQQLAGIMATKRKNAALKGKTAFKGF